MSRTPTDPKPAKEVSGSSFLAEVRGSAGQAPEGPGAPRPGKRFSSTYIVAGVMTAMSALALVGMREYGKKSGVRVDQFRTEEIKSVKSESVTAAQTQKVLAELERHGTLLQIPADVIRRNPFLLGTATPVVVDNSGRINAEAEKRVREAAEREKRERESALAEKLRGLEVTAVIMGQRPVVRISGKLYRVGDQVAKTFSVLEISERGVKLGFEGAEYELTIKQNLNPDGSRPDAEADAAPRPRPGAR